MADRKRTDPDWQDVRTFLALARHGSLAAAARALSVNHATVSRRLRALEESVGERLVERRPGGHVLTPAGSRVLAAAGDMEQAAKMLGHGSADDAPAGLVRISAPPALAAGFLTPRLAALAVRYPKLDVELAPDHRFVSLERHQADVAVRFGRPEDGDVVARPLATVGYGFYGTAEVCRSVEAGDEPAFVGFDEANAHLPEARWLRRHFPRARVRYRASDQFGQALAARAGAGLALVPHYLGRGDPLLRPCDLGSAPPSADVFLLTRSRDRRDGSIRAVADALVAMFGEADALFRNAGGDNRRPV